MMNHSQWLAERQKGIGGSDAAAILGLNPWSTPYAVWADKTGKLPPKEDNEVMRQGRDLEQYVAERFTEETGKKCRRKTSIIKNPKYPFALANVDRMIVGENAGLECKTTSSLNLKKFKNGEFPETYYCQCMHYMAVTGADRWYLAVLVLGRGFYTFTIERDEEEITALMGAEKDFWQYVEKNTPPPVDGFKPTTEAINALYLEGNSDCMPLDLFGREKDLKEYLELSSMIKFLEQKKELIAQTIKEDLQESEAGFTGSFKVTWKSQTRSTFNYKDFIKDNPVLKYDQYFKHTTFRKFDIKEIN